MLWCRVPIFHMLKKINPKCSANYCSSTTRLPTQSADATTATKKPNSSTSLIHVHNTTISPQRTYVSIEMATDLNINSVYSLLYRVRLHTHLADSADSSDLMGNEHTRWAQSMQKSTPESTLQKSPAWNPCQARAFAFSSPQQTIFHYISRGFCNPKLPFAEFSNVLLEVLTIGRAFDKPEQLCDTCRLEDFTVYFLVKITDKNQCFRCLHIWSHLSINKLFFYSFKSQCWNIYPENGQTLPSLLKCEMGYGIQWWKRWNYGRLNKN